MTDSSDSPASRVKVLLAAGGVLVVFGFLAMILMGSAGHESPEDKAYKGDFDAATTQQRWDNLAEVKAAQATLVDETKVKAAMVAVAKGATKESPTDVVVPGSPTFLKQAEAAATPAPATPAPATPAPATPAPATPAPATPAPATPAPATPAPATPAPATPAPATPAPATPAPATPAPATPAPATPAPATPAPATPAPATPAPATPAPAAPAPAAPAPANP